MAGAGATFKSQNPDIDVPKNVSLWSWIFESPYSSLARTGQDETQGFTDVTTGQHINYRELKQLTTYLSTALKKVYRLEEGDVIIVYSKNSVWYPLSMLSAARVGVVACGVSPEYTVDELTYALSASKAKVILSQDGNSEKARLAATKAGLSQDSVVLLDSESSSKSISGLIQTAKKLGDSAQVSPYQVPGNKTNHDVCAYLGFSSGTTGLPKGVMISHANVIAQCMQIQQITPADHNRILAALPFYHITGIVHQLHLPIALNAHVYILPSFTLDQLLKTVADCKIRELLIVPPILIRMVREPETVAKYDLSHVQRFSSGAAPLSQEILTLLEKQFPGTGFKQGYGMTESCSAITSHPPSKYAFKYAAKVGTVVASTEVRIVDPDTGKDCRAGEAGEIWARGPQVAMGYLNNAKATAETFDKDGFLHTGDIGMLDEEGLLSITDRMKEMVKVKGIGVAPAELESLLLGNPAVHDCAVCGVPDDRAGERPKAFVVLNASYEARPAEAARELLDYVKSNKARHKWMAEIEVVQEIPKSAAGKILRKKLRQPSGDSGNNVIVRDERFTAKL